LSSYSLFFKNVFTLTWGTVVAQLVAILLQPLLRRYFSPQDFGAYAIYTSLIGVFVIIGSMRFELSIVLQSKKVDADYMLKISFFSAFLVFIIISVILAAKYNWIANKLDFPESKKWWLYFFPFSLFLQSIYQSISNYLIRCKDFVANAKNKFFRRVGEGGVQISAGVFNIPFGLVIGDVFGNLINCLSGVYQIKKNGFKNIPLFSKGKFAPILKKNYSFPLYNGIPAFLNNLALLLPIFIVSRSFEINIVGQYDLARMLFIIPSALISQSISQVLFQKVAETKNREESFLPFFLRLLLLVSLISGLSLLILRIYGVELVMFVFGDNWRQAGEMVKVLSISFFVSFISSTLSTTLVALGKIKVWSVWQIFYFILIFFLLLKPWDSIQDFLKQYIIIDVISYSIYLISIFLSVIFYDRSLIMKKVC